MYQAQLEKLTQFASDDALKEELLKAKAEYFGATGEVFEDDSFFEMRMSSFLDYFLFDYVLTGQQKTPAQLYLEKAQAAVTPEELEILRGFTMTRHSLWEVRKLAKDLVRLRDVFTGKDVDVFERRQPAGLKKGDLIEARLIPVDGKLLFSQAFCFHPEDAKKPTYKEIKRLKKQNPAFSPRDFIWSLARMRLKIDRYRNIAVKDIYAFDRKTI